MHNQVNIHEAKTHLSQLIEQVEAGEEIIIARAGAPVARLIAIGVAEQSPRVLGTLAGRVQLPSDCNAPLPDAVLADFEGR
ncbi:MAG: type II toxin-antitoxin system prevent-host-death family antitoxin [Thiohalocapsa sp.]